MSDESLREQLAAANDAIARVRAEIRRYANHGTPVSRQVADHFAAALTPEAPQ